MAEKIKYLPQPELIRGSLVKTENFSGSSQLCFFKKGLRIEQENRNLAELDFEACNRSEQAKNGNF